MKVLDYWPLLREDTDDFIAEVKASNSQSKNKTKL